MLWLVLSSLVRGGTAYTGAMMGVSSDCDDAQTKLEVDWDTKDFTVFTCPSIYPFPVKDVDVINFEMKDINARKDIVGHKCMNESIRYKDVPPLRGDHRPNWPVYGEYLYVPPQRWLHNLEHGSIILLYHPCVDENELSRLRQLVTGCIYRHIITPYNKLSEERPLALVAWAAKLEMSAVNDQEVVRFIRKHAHIAPEDISRNGLYNLYLVKKAKVVTSKKDLELCPSFPRSPTDPTVPLPPPNE